MLSALVHTVEQKEGTKTKSNDAESGLALAKLY
jgi:hypothetical protein